MLSDPVQRAVYDEIHGYTATAINPFFDDSAPKDHVFVDEFTCIGIDNSAYDQKFLFVLHKGLGLFYFVDVDSGCKNCANVCPNVFKIEEDFGRSRVYSQSGSTELIQDAIDSW